MLIAGAFNLHGNNKIDLMLNLNKYKEEARKVGFPAYGEHPASNFFQRAGYQNIRSMDEYRKNYFSFWKD